MGLFALPPVLGLLLPLLAWPGVAAGEREALAMELPQSMAESVALTGWQYQPGDNPEWARRDFDDRAWSSVSTELLAETPLPPGWAGVAWFRLRIVPNRALAASPLALVIRQEGASEIYLDGRRLASFGTVGVSDDEERSHRVPVPVALPLGERSSHVIAVRYSNQRWELLHALGRSAGFSARVAEFSPAVEGAARALRRTIASQIFFSAVPLGFAVLHLFLFFFYPAARQNLYYAIVAALFAAVTYLDTQQLLVHSLTAHLLLGLAFRWVLLGALVAFLRFAYSLAGKRLPLSFWVFVAIALGLALVSLLEPMILTKAAAGFGLFAIGEILRVFVGLRGRKEGLDVVVYGVVFALGTGSYDLLQDLGLLPRVLGVEQAYPLGVLGVVVAMSVYLSRSFARTRRNLETQVLQLRQLSERSRMQEHQSRILKAKYVRKSEELEKARQLQLSMLPRQLPSRADLDIAVHMKTATEVGGDYYDFAEAADGTLTVAIGDATGHGAQSGVVVTATKGLVSVLAQEEDLVAVLRKISLGLRRMNLPRLHMALALVRLHNGGFEITNAGMPPALVYRARDGSVEELALRGMPLGSLADYPYEAREVAFRAGDTLLLMSDGFLETVNQSGEPLGFERAQEIFGRLASLEASQVVARLSTESQEWCGGCPPQDDVTFVVLKSR